MARAAAVALAAAVPAAGATSPTRTTAVTSSLAAATTARAAAAAASPKGGGWVVLVDGTVEPFGGAVAHGSLAGQRLSAPVVGIASTPSGQGYWLVGSDGRVSGFGDARSYGSTTGVHLAEPVVGMAATPSGHGYWLVASDGGIFAFGDARFYGSTGGVRLVRPVVGIASTRSGHGYWLVASDGGIFAFGDARFYGSTGGVKLARPVIGMAPAANGAGYLMVAADGGVFSFGSSRFAGSMSRSNLTIAGIAPQSGGYYVVTSAGQVVPFGISGPAPVVSSGPSPTTVASGGTSPTTIPLTTNDRLPAALAGRYKLFGLSPDGNSAGIANLPALAAQLHHPIDVVNIFMGWNQPLPVSSLNAIVAQGSIPELTWEQWPAGGGADQPAYADSIVTAGTYDAYIRSVAAEAKAWDGPILIRYGHEMNGNWYPWAASVNGNTPAGFVAAWRHVHDIFTSSGVTNVRWVWCVNAGGPTPIAQVYPGDSYVDIVGMDGYDRGNATTGVQTPAGVFSGLLTQVGAVAPAKPILINETGTTAAAGDTGTWMEQLLAYVKAQPKMMGVVYSDFGNWVIDGSTSAIAGATTGLATYNS